VKKAEEIAQVLQAEGKRITVQRALILRIIQESEGHLDAHEIYRRAQKEEPRISLSTVYRTLGVLKEIGLIRELHLDEEHHHYELVRGETHYHLICSGCGRIVEFQSPLIAQLVEEVRRENDFEIHSTHIDIVGLCPRCRKPENTDASK